VADNIIPPACDLTIDRRMLPGETFAEVDAQIDAIRAKAAEQGVCSDILGHTSRAGPAEIALDDPLAQAALAASHRHAPKEMPPGGFLGGCDLVHFDAVGIKGLVMGPGDLAQAHTPDEWIDTDEFVQGVKVYRDLALDWFRRLGGTP
jgi:acetylornithine deacetylase/succinyl-diaminopimelate desuccinylase-like protein